MNWRFFKGVFAAWIAASIAEFPIRWVLYLSGYISLASVSAYQLLLLIAIYIMAEFLEKLPRPTNLKAIKYGALFGLFFSIPDLVHQIYQNNSPLFFLSGNELSLLPVIVDVVAFALAAFVYSKIDSR